MNKRHAIIWVVAIIVLAGIALMAHRSYAPVLTVPDGARNSLPTDAGAPDMGVLQ